MRLPVRRSAYAAAVAALVANVLIVLTGALVRLTGSGLGCPTWPSCTDDSFVTTPEMGVHGVVEFGNRVLGIVVGLITLALVVAVARHRDRPPKALPLAVGVLVGVGLQGLIGGLSVRRALAPEIVAVHFLVSTVLVAALVVLVDLLGRPDAVLRAPADLRLRIGLAAMPVALAGVLVLGTLVTGSGPHAGDEDARRFGFDPAEVAAFHVLFVVVLLGLQVGAAIVLRTPAAFAAVALSITQGVIGSVQEALALPVPLVAAHVVTAALVVAATTHLTVRAFRV
ncbi:cytochrome c oxidase assembly protein subunit 15 [Saccharothrix carnea]|uniref:Cytochrome c oxidase assembly protein subunit 15 n=1 Tax=Saccharothrix carnea TaxID=1280637 RepID=A0A2P8I1Q2_SACCR|nr:cytochrome c oxidase assembly protein subunit 15 [Saccharothrix carnea]